MDLSQTKKVLIIRLSSLGDVLLTTPLIRSLKKKYPEIKFDFVAREEYYDILINNPYLNKIFNYADSQFERQNLINLLIAESYDLIIDLQNNFRSKEIIHVLKCPIKKFKKKNLQKFLLVQFKLNNLADEPPIPVRYANALSDFQIDEDGLDFVTNKPASEMFANKKLYVGLCPGAKHFTKRWPIQYYIELGKMLEGNDYSVVLFGGKDDILTCDEIAKQLPQCLNLCNSDDILQTGADMKMCKAVYCNDSGLMHIAAALKVPVMAFFGSTVKEFGFFPYKAKSLVLQNESLNCRPCSHIGKSHCPKKHFKCLNDITPQTAFNKLRTVINN